MTKENLSKKDLDYANLAGSDLSNADGSQASLRRSRLTGTRLENANLSGSDLHGAHLEHADMAGADLRDADLTEAHLHGVDLTQAAHLEGVKLAGAKGVNDDFAALVNQPAEQVHLERILENCAVLNGELADVVGSLFAASRTTGEQNSASSDDSRRAVLTRIGEIRTRLDALEEELVTTIEEGMTLHPGSTIDDR